MIISFGYKASPTPTRAVVETKVEPKQEKDLHRREHLTGRKRTQRILLEWKGVAGEDLEQE